MKPLLPTHAMTFFGPTPAGEWGGVPWDQCAIQAPGMYLPNRQQPMFGKLAVWAEAKVLILTGNVDDDTDGPGGSTAVDPCYDPITSLRWADGSSINSREFRGMVMHRIAQMRGAGLGDFGIVCWGGVIHCVQYFDEGPTEKLQEGAEKILRDTGVIDAGQTSRHAAVAGNDVQDFCSLIFCGSAPKDQHGRPYAVPQDEMIARTLALWKKFTGRPLAPANSSGAGTSLALALIALAGLSVSGCADAGRSFDVIRSSPYYPEKLIVNGTVGRDDERGWDRETVGMGLEWSLKLKLVTNVPPIAPSHTLPPDSTGPR